MNTAQHCRLCQEKELTRLLQIDNIPISHYLRKSQSDSDPRFSIVFKYCGNCGLLQITDAIPADIIYAADTYTTGFQHPRHLDDLITTALTRQDPGKVIDIGCNDGALMEALRNAGYGEIVGVEPNPIAAAMARKKGYKVYNSYLTTGSAAGIVADCGQFDTIFLRHVVEHVSELNEFFAAVLCLLKPRGFLVLELPDVEQGFTLGSPAVLWEEHVSYFTQTLAQYMLERFGFQVVDRRQYAFGGGSFAFIAQRQDKMGVSTPECPEPSRMIAMLRDFAEGIAQQKREIKDLIDLALSSDYRILMYGAAPRSCLLTSVCEISDKIDFVVDDREDIHYRLMPGTSHLIHPLSDLAAAKGDKILCLLGVGSEHEFRVRRKIKAVTAANPAYVSLFPPRNMLESIGDARHAINEHQHRG